ncbi:MAG: hypothetical protein PVG39_24800 [Desulfobacteraceae bacterium]|jgi:hypothetical protein
MKHYTRKTTPQVKLGQVQRKNRWELTPNYYNTPQKYPVFDKEKPGRGYKHLIKKSDLYKFIEILPAWETLSIGLNAVVLSEGDVNCMGWHNHGVVGITAWEKQIEWNCCAFEFYDDHKELLNKLNIPCSKGNGAYIIKFNEDTAKAFQLIHIFIHELGHHHDRMNTKSKISAARGEQYAKKYEDNIIKQYMRVFNL